MHSSKCLLYSKYFGGAFMKNAKFLRTLYTTFAIAICIVMLGSLFGQNSTIAFAETQETLYYEDLYSGNPTNGTVTIADYEVYYDSYEITEIVAHVSAPSFKNWSSEYSNYCGPLTGMNVIGFFDRWYTNLVPNYTPGMIFSNGTYNYYPDLGQTTTRNAFNSLYGLMRTGELGGTTSTNFKNGLNTYVSNAGYSFSYSSCYLNTTSINLTELAIAINQNKVAILMCSEYNYILKMSNVASESKMSIIKNNSTIAHMMMVYGYKTIAYYKDNVNFRTDTFLLVTSSTGTGDVGYMQMNDFAIIDEALIMTIS